jgi:hypothetical protein
VLMSPDLGTGKPIRGSGTPACGSPKGEIEAGGDGR